MNELTRQGIEALKSGDRAAARKLLASALQQDQEDVTAWLWLSAAVDTEGQKVDCLRHVLRIDPNNEAAAKGLSVLLERKARTQPPVPDQALAADQEGELDQPETETAEQDVDETVIQPEQPEVETATGDANAELAVMEAAETQVVDTSPTEEEAVEPASIPVPTRRTRETPDPNEPGVTVFKTRPSQVPALLSFWVFLIGSILVGTQLSAMELAGMLIAFALWMVLEVVVLFVVIRNFRTRYELTTTGLLIRSAELSRKYFLKPPRKNTFILPLSDVYAAECHQTLFQRIAGFGDIALDTAINGELTRLRLRGVADCQKRAQQIVDQIKGVRE